MFVNFIGIPFRNRYNNAYNRTGRMKPIDCELCMAFWIGFVYGLNSGLLYAFGYGAVCGCLALFIFRKLFL